MYRVGEDRDTESNKDRDPERLVNRESEKDTRRNLKMVERLQEVRG